MPEINSGMPIENAANPKNLFRFLSCGLVRMLLSGRENLHHKSKFIEVSQKKADK